MKKTLLLTLLLLPLLVSAQDATAIVKKAFEQNEGNSQYSEMTMQIVRPRWTRTVKFKLATKGKDKALVLITAPPKEQGQTFLMVDGQMWMYTPRINSLVKLGPSMMSQGWMGSDYSNNEVMDQGSIVTDYNHKIIGSEKLEGYDCWKVELTPKPDAAVVWGKQIMWIDKQHYMILKTELYDEDMYLVKTQLGQEVKVMDGRTIPTKFVIIPEDDPDHKTILTINKIKFDINVPDSFFTVQNMKRGMSIRFSF